MKTIQIIFNFLLFASSVLLGFSAYASDSVPSNIQILGRGVVNSETGDTVLISCYQSKKSDTCETLRLIQVRKEGNPTWLGSSFQNSLDIRETLKIWVDASISKELHSLSTSKKIYSFTSKDGWNWSSSPTPLPDQNFKQLISSLLYFAEYQASVESNPVVPSTQSLDLKPRGGNIASDAMVMYGTFSERGQCRENIYFRSLKKQIQDRYVAIGGNIKDLIFRTRKEAYGEIGQFKICRLVASSADLTYGIEVFSSRTETAPGLPDQYRGNGVFLEQPGFQDDPQLILIAYEDLYFNYYRWFKKPTQ